MRQLATHVRSGGRIQDSGASRQSWARRFAKEATHAAERWLWSGEGVWISKYIRLYRRLREIEINTETRFDELLCHVNPTTRVCT